MLCETAANPYTHRFLGYGGQKYRSRFTSSDLFLVQTNTNLETPPKPNVSPCKVASLLEPTLTV